MNRRTLEEFLMFAQERNYSAASKKLLTTRTTLRDHIMRLENDLGVPLVCSMPGEGVGLTQYGHRFVEDAAKLLSDMDAIVEKYQIMGRDRLSLNIGSMDFVWLEPALFLARDEFVRKNPSKHLDIAAVGRDDIARALSKDQVDLAVVSLKKWQQGNMRFEELELPGKLAFKVNEEETQLLVPSSHPLFKKDRIVARDLDGQMIVLPSDIVSWWTRDGVLDRLESAGAHVSLAGLPFQDQTSYFAYRFNDCLGGVSRRQALRSGLSARQDCRAMSISDMPLISEFYLVCSERFLEKPAARSFLECLEMHAQANYA